MKGFEVVQSAQRAYIFVWENRRLCVRYGVFPFVATLACYAALIVSGMADNMLRQGLFLLPAYFVEGAVVALLVRMAIDMQHKQRNFPDVFEQKRLLMAATVIYVLAQMAFAVVAHFGMQFSRQLETQATQSSAPLALLSMAVFGLFLWAVRLVWLYVPVVLGYGVARYLRIFRSFSCSFYMIGVALLVSVPVYLAMWIVIQMLGAVLGLSGGALSVAPLIVFGAIQVLANLVSGILSGVAMAYAMYPFLAGKSER